MKYMKLLLLCLLIGLCCSCMVSCEHRQLVEINGTYYVRVYLNEQIKNVTCGFYNPEYNHPEYKIPQALRVALASRDTGEILHEAVLRNYDSDERGSFMDGYIGAVPGEYNLLVYELGSSVTHIGNFGENFGISAYTDPVSDRIMAYLPSVGEDIDRAKIVLEPEHLMATLCADVSVPMSMSVDTLKTETGDYFYAESIAKSYYLQLRIKGVEWVHAAAAVLSGMSGSVQLGYEEGLVMKDPVNLFFIMGYADKRLYTTFTTFGKMPEQSSVLNLNFEFTKKDGSTQVEKIDITDVFKTPEAIENQWLLLDKEIVISKPSGTGGMAPGVEGWKDIETDIIM